LQHVLGRLSTPKSRNDKGRPEHWAASADGKPRAAVRLPLIAPEDAHSDVGSYKPAISYDLSGQAGGAGCAIANSEAGDSSIGDLQRRPYRL